MIDLDQNAAHSERVYTALARAYPAEVESLPCLIAHALTDLRHLADQHDLSFATRDRVAHMQYLAETGA